MAKKARLVFMPIDYDYQAKYGKMPDYDFTDRLKAGEDSEEVAKLIFGRMDAILEEQKRIHEGNNWQEATGCPF